MIHNNVSSNVFKRSMMITALLAVLVVISLMVGVAYTNMDSVDQWVLDAQPWLSYWRLLLFIVVFGSWNKWSTIYAKGVGMTEQQLSNMLGYRWRMALWVIVMELLFSQNMLSQFAKNIGV